METAQQMTHKAMDQAQHLTEMAKGTVTQTAEALKQAATHPQETLASGLQQAQQMVSSTFTAAKERVYQYLPTVTKEGKTVSDPEGTKHVDQMEYYFVEQPFAKLNNGRVIPLLGLGTWRAQHDDAYNAVRAALKAGYRAIDTAAIYGNEEDIGRALKDIFAEGKIKREDVHVTSKLWNSDHGRVEEALKESLSKLGLDYLDLFLMHWPLTTETSDEGPTPPLHETWQAMEAVQQKGLTRSIGVSNFSVKKVEDLIERTGVVPSVNQVECHIYWRQSELLAFCRSHGIHMMAYSPLGSQPVGDSEGAKEADTKHPLEDPEVVRIAKEHRTSPGAVCIRWLLQRGISTIPKSASFSRIMANLRQVMGLELSDQEMEVLSTRPYQKRMIPGKMFVKSDGHSYPHTVEEIWE